MQKTEKREGEKTPTVDTEMSTDDIHHQQDCLLKTLCTLSLLIFFLDMENNKAGALLLYHILHTPKLLIVTVDANFCAMSQKCHKFQRLYFPGQKVYL